MKNIKSGVLEANGHSGNGHGYAGVQSAVNHEAIFGYPRDFLENEFVYLVISPRANGLSVGVNLNPVMKCSLNCLYCEVDREQPPRAADLDIDRMTVELRQTLELVQGGWLRQWPRYAKLPPELLEVRHVTLSGDGEPTLSSQFVEATQAVVGLRSSGRFFKIVLVTNSTALDQPDVQAGVRQLISSDEIWAKLDGGTQEYLSKINGPTASLEKTLANILLVARRRPVIVQSLFPAVNGEEPSAQEIKEYALRLKELKAAGAQIPLVQIYSATRPMARLGCGHLPLKSLMKIAQTVKKVSGLRAEVF
ncbi:MAG TPA: radical SAM protein [Verrucomicrobiae bacterium]|nr:radical SAM protein [Verrucomicrobiae bacterium]